MPLCMSAPPPYSVQLQISDEVLAKQSGSQCAALLFTNYKLNTSRSSKRSLYQVSRPL